MTPPLVEKADARWKLYGTEIEFILAEFCRVGSEVKFARHDAGYRNDEQWWGRWIERIERGSSRLRDLLRERYGNPIGAATVAGDLQNAEWACCPRCRGRYDGSLKACPKCAAPAYDEQAIAEGLRAMADDFPKWPPPGCASVLTKRQLLRLAADMLSADKTKDGCR